MFPNASDEGYIDFGEWRTWYRVTGELGARAPLIVAHGGPGCSHDYLLSLTQISRSGRPVIHYDQLGGGRSTHLPERGAEFFTVELFLAELDRVIEHLELTKGYHLLGQSWGGMLAAEQAIRRPAGLRSLVISNSPASMELWAVAAEELRAQLPDEVRDALERHERDSSFQDPEYVAASQVYYDRHVCRVVPNPPEVVATFELLASDPTVYNTMNGPNEFFCIGSLRDWSVVERVSSITVPTLVLSGRYDEAAPVAVRPFAESIPGARWEIFENSSHMPFVEEPERYLDVVERFLDQHDDIPAI